MLKHFYRYPANLSFSEFSFKDPSRCPVITVINVTKKGVASYHIINAIRSAADFLTPPTVRALLVFAL